MPEIIEISGLSNDTQDSKISAWLLVGSIVAVVAIIKYLRKPPSGLGDLGIIVPCRKKDQKSGKPASGQQWCLWTSQKTRILGRHPTYKKALSQERLIQMRKHGR